MLLAKRILFLKKGIQKFDRKKNILYNTCMLHSKTKTNAIYFLWNI